MEELINQYFYEKTVAKIQNFSLNYVETIKNFIYLYKNSEYSIIGILPKEITGFTCSSAFNTNHHKILKRCEEITRYRIFFVYLQYLKTNQSIT